MPEQSARLGIPLPLGNENVSRQAIREMLQAVDDHAETIAGAQAKADAAEAAAKAYGDSAAGGVSSALAAHEADFTQQIPYAVTSGSANAYAASTTPALPALVTGVAITVKIHAANTGAATLNWNGKGAKAIKKANGSDVSSGNLKLNGVYTLRYDGTSFILQGEGGEYGTAGAPQVLAPYTIGTGGGLVTGTIPSKSAQTYTPGKINQKISAEQYLSGDQTILGDSNLVPEAIAQGVTIFGVVGTVVQTGSKVFATPGVYSWTPPLGITKVTVTITSATGGAGGGGGGYGTKFDHESCNAGTVYYPAGGGYDGENGASGGVTSFDSLLSLSATGIGYGGKGSINGGAGGAGYGNGSSPTYPTVGGRGGVIGGGDGAGGQMTNAIAAGGGGGGHHPATLSAPTQLIVSNRAYTITIGAGGAGGKGGAGGLAGAGGYTGAPGKNGENGSNGIVSITW